MTNKKDDTNSHNLIRLIKINDPKVYKSIVLVIYSNSSTLNEKKCLKKDHFNDTQQRIASFKCHKLYTF